MVIDGVVNGEIYRAYDHREFYVSFVVFHENIIFIY